jgi:hypothetical protein
VFEANVVRVHSHLANLAALIWYELHMGGGSPQNSRPHMNLKNTGGGTLGTEKKAAVITEDIFKSESQPLPLTLLTHAEVKEQAYRMIDAFVSIGVDAFDLEVVEYPSEAGQKKKIALDGRGRPVSYHSLPVDKIKGMASEVILLCNEMVSKGHYWNPIIRPHLSYIDRQLIQLDDLDAGQLKLIDGLAFLLVATSPTPKGNQAWVCIESGDDSITRRVKQEVASDRSASGCVRLAGSLNAKMNHRASSHGFPVVGVAEVVAGLLVQVEELETRGLLADPMIETREENYAGEEHRPWPNYDAFLNKQNPDWKRSGADTAWCATAMNPDLPYAHSPWATAEMLMQVSEKARERGMIYAWGRVDAGQRAINKKNGESVTVRPVGLSTKSLQVVHTAASKRSSVVGVISQDIKCDHCRAKLFPGETPCPICGAYLDWGERNTEPV